MSPTITRAVIAGGGTGGHVYPAVAVAEELARRCPELSVGFIGSTKGLENRILPPLGYELHTITVSRIKGGGLLERLRGVLRVPVGIFQSWRILRRYDPQIVLGVGGYASGPALLAAWMTRRPTAIQEQNAHAGFTNRVLGKLVQRVFVGFAAAGKHFAERKLVVSGNPLRAAVSEALKGASERSSHQPGTLRVLVFGGSQGARFLNENVPAALSLLAERHPDLTLTVVHQTGVADEEITRERYAATPLAAVTTVTPFIDDMPSAYAAADLAVSRAGALTVAELTAVGLPALLVPFPFAADNHQESNANVMVEAGAGRMIRQPDWSAGDVADWLGAIAIDEARLSEMSRASRAQARPRAASELVDGLEGLAR